MYIYIYICVYIYIYIYRSYQKLLETAPEERRTPHTRHLNVTVKLQSNVTLSYTCI